MGDEEKDKITAHGQGNLLAAIFDEQSTDFEAVSGSQTEEADCTGGQLRAGGTQGFVEEQNATEEARPVKQFRDSLELSDEIETTANKEDHRPQQHLDNSDSLESSVIPINSRKPTVVKSTSVKSSPLRIPSKRSSGVEFINKNKENVRHPISRTYAAMHRAKVKEKWNDTRRRKDSSNGTVNQHWTQNDLEGEASFEAGSIPLGTDREGGSDSTSSNDFLAKGGASEGGGYHQIPPDLPPNAREFQPYAQLNQMGPYDRSDSYPYPVDLPNLQSSFASQSAPPGMYSHLRKPLADQFGCLPEEESYLSSTLVSDANFLYHGHGLPGSRTANSRLHHKFASEPCLVGANSELSNGRAASIDSHPGVSYKPYTLRDYKRVREMGPTSLGGLGPNTDTSEHKERIRKVSKQKEYAGMLRQQHASLKKHWQKHPPPPSHGTPQAKQGEAKRQAALNYAKSVPKPKKFITREKAAAAYEQSEDRPVRDLTLTEMLRMRHEKEKNEVDAIRRELASKIRL